MISSKLASSARQAVPLLTVTSEGYQAWLKTQTPRLCAWLEVQNFAAKAGSFVLVSDENGALGAVVVGLSSPPSLWDLASLPSALPSGAYRLDPALGDEALEKLALGWLCGGLAPDFHKDSAAERVQKLILPLHLDFAELERVASTMGFVRNLISRSAEQLGPEELAAAVKEVALKHKATVTEIVGDKLLKANYPAIHAIGRGSARPARLLDLRWGKASHPRVTLVGKGVCFDTGGLDLKPPAYMQYMQKDMGGAAVALGLASLIMGAKLPVRLRLLIPALENMVSGTAVRPGDVLSTRAGLKVEFGNTDAEGRMVLADCLCEAASENPDLLLDFSTLTGAARVAVGYEMSAFLTDDEPLAQALSLLGEAQEDPLWRLPLYKPYEKSMETPFADVNCAPHSSMADATIAGLFLKRFVGEVRHWAHFDFPAWIYAPKPGRPEGGEAMSMRACYRLCRELFQAVPAEKRAPKKRVNESAPKTKRAAR